MSLPREEVLKAFHNQEVEHVPVSFWRHFAENEFGDVYQDPTIRDANIEGHKQYVKDLDFDFSKTMLDGYFPYPFRGVENPRDLDDLANLVPLEEDDPWIQDQVALAKEQNQIVGDLPTLITVFSPLILLKWAQIDHTKESILTSDVKFADLYEKNPERVEQVLQVIAVDQGKVVRALKKGTEVDGIYYSTQSIQDPREDNLEFFKKVMEPIDLIVQEEINRNFDLNILHVCGFAGAYNHLEWFTNYPLQVINWATLTDGVPLGEGKKLFGDRPVLGGFDNSIKGLLYTGTKEEIQQNARDLIDEAGKKGVILGADCTVPRDTPYDHLRWVIEAARDY